MYIVMHVYNKCIVFALQVWQTSNVALQTRPTQRAIPWRLPRGWVSLWVALSGRCDILPERHCPASTTTGTWLASSELLAEAKDLRWTTFINLQAIRCVPVVVHVLIWPVRHAFRSIRVHLIDPVFLYVYIIIYICFYSFLLNSFWIIYHHSNKE